MHDASMVTDVLFLWTVLFKVTGLTLQVPDKRQHPPYCCAVLSCTEHSGSLLKCTAFVSQYSLRDFYFSNNGWWDRHFKNLWFFRIPSIPLERHAIKMPCPLLAFTLKAGKAFLWKVEFWAAQNYSRCATKPYLRLLVIFAPYLSWLVFPTCVKLACFPLFFF